MNFDEEKIDEYTRALLYLVAHERHEGMGARAWKGFDWETLNRLYDKGYITVKHPTHNALKLKQISEISY